MNSGDPMAAILKDVVQQSEYLQKFRASPAYFVPSNNTLQCAQLGELPFLEDELAIKVRKPYTITKQREKWTDTEHQKFLEAIKLYGRSWRHIEEHIGTKSAIQIRSHAQKFFTKLEREQSNRGDPASSLQEIDIPPPRPKRKPNHPYPRKAQTQTEAANFSISPQSHSARACAAIPSKLSTPCYSIAGSFEPAVHTPLQVQLDRKGSENLHTGEVRESHVKHSVSVRIFGQTFTPALSPPDDFHETLANGNKAAAIQERQGKSSFSERISNTKKDCDSNNEQKIPQQRAQYQKPASKANADTAAENFHDKMEQLPLKECADQFSKSCNLSDRSYNPKLFMNERMDNPYALSSASDMNYNLGRGYVEQRFAKIQEVFSHQYNECENTAVIQNLLRTHGMHSISPFNSAAFPAKFYGSWNKEYSIMHNVERLYEAVERGKADTPAAVATLAAASAWWAFQVAMASCDGFTLNAPRMEAVNTAAAFRDAIYNDIKEQGMVEDFPAVDGKVFGNHVSQEVYSQKESEFITPDLSTSSGENVSKTMSATCSSGNHDGAKRVRGSSESELFSRRTCIKNELHHIDDLSSVSASECVQTARGIDAEAADNQAPSSLRRGRQVISVPSDEEHGLDDSNKRLKRMSGLCENQPALTNLIAQLQADGSENRSEKTTYCITSYSNSENFEAQKYTSKRIDRGGDTSCTRSVSDLARSSLIAEIEHEFLKAFQEAREKTSSPNSVLEMDLFQQHKDSANSSPRGVSKPDHKSNGLDLLPSYRFSDRIDLHLSSYMHVEGYHDNI